MSSNGQQWAAVGEGGQLWASSNGRQEHPRDRYRIRGPFQLTCGRWMTAGPRRCSSRRHCKSFPFRLHGPAKAVAVACTKHPVAAAASECKTTGRGAAVELPWSCGTQRINDPTTALSRVGVRICLRCAVHAMRWMLRCSSNGMCYWMATG